MVVDDYKKIWREILNLSENHKFLDVSHLSIPFSAINDSNKPQDIYVGQEKISFKDRNQDYKKIFIQEFLT
ncbi:MAG: hypothetical protein ACFFC3_05465 [Candidatus Odinarchaeota archaeon]